MEYIQIFIPAPVLSAVALNPVGRGVCPRGLPGCARAPDCYEVHDETLKIMTASTASEQKLQRSGHPELPGSIGVESDIVI